MGYIIAGGLVALAVFGIVLAIRYAKRSAQARERSQTLQNGAELEAEAEAHLSVRRRGSELLARLRRKRGGD